MRTLHIVIPMAGLGSRFQTEGFVLPKPLIPVDKQPMFLKAISSFDNIKCPKKYTFIVRYDHVNKFQIDKTIKRHIPNAKIIITNDPPIGAAVDCLRAKQFVNKNHSVVFLDCDLYFQSTSYFQTITECLKHTSDYTIAGAILYFQSYRNRYSYAKIKNGCVAQTAEKKVISSNAIVGSYFFSSSKQIFDIMTNYVKQQLSSNSKEYYISPLYNILINNKQKIRACPVDEYFSFGTPEELDKYKKFNHKKHPLSSI